MEPTKLPPGDARQAVIDQLRTAGASYAQVGADPRVGVSKQRVAQITTTVAASERPGADPRRDLKVSAEVHARFRKLRREMDDTLPEEHPRKLDASGRRMGLTQNATMTALLDVAEAAIAARKGCPKVDKILKEVGL